MTYFPLLSDVQWWLYLGGDACIVLAVTLVAFLLIEQINP